MQVPSGSLRSTPSLDPTWLSDEQWVLRNGIDASRTQMRLWLLNTNPDAGQLGVIQSELGQEAVRYLATAISATRDPTNKSCFGEPLEVCYSSFVVNIQNRLSTTSEPAERVKILQQYLALDTARSSPQDIRTLSAPNTALTARIIEKFEADISLHNKRSTFNGVIESQQQEEAKPDGK
ncbi:MAG: hypothetical protein LRZ84_14655 [Desertifilum sp.]|nr:hypothetical protein [Desertifilum sp.]